MQQRVELMLAVVLFTGHDVLTDKPQHECQTVLIEDRTSAFHIVSVHLYIFIWLFLNTTFSVLVSLKVTTQTETKATLL